VQKTVDAFAIRIDVLGDMIGRGGAMHCLHLLMQELYTPSV